MTKNKFLSYTSFLILVLASSGCASIISGKHQEVTFNSNPDGATVTVTGRIIGKTPITTALKKASGQSMVFEKEGYKPVTMQLETTMNPWFWGNILLGGLIGSTTDGISGAVYQYSPSQYMVTLQPLATGPLESHTAISDNQKRKDYIVINYKEIMMDLQKGGGEHLTSLLSLLNVPSDQSDDTIKRIRGLSEAYPDIPQFADHVIEAFAK